MRISALALFVSLLLSPALSMAETNQPKRLEQLREMNDQAFSQYLANDMDPDAQRNIAYVLSSTNQDKLNALRAQLTNKGLKVGKVWMLKKDNNGEHYVLEVIFNQTLSDKEKLLQYSKLIDGIANENNVQFIGWAAAQTDAERAK